MRAGRTCYDHLAGRLGVAVADGLVQAEVLQPADRASRPRRAARLRLPRPASTSAPARAHDDRRRSRASTGASSARTSPGHWEPRCSAASRPSAASSGSRRAAPCACCRPAAHCSARSVSPASSDDPTSRIRATQRLGVALVAGAAVTWSTAGYFTHLIHVRLFPMLVWRNLFGGLFMLGFRWSDGARVDAARRSARSGASAGSWPSSTG